MERADSGHIGLGTLFESARLKAVLDTASQSHLNDCDQCRGRLSWMQTAATLGQQELEYEPPKAVLDNVLQLGRRPGLLKQLGNFIVASLTFDNFGSLAPAGVRHTEETARQVTYEAGDIEIALSVRPSPAGATTLTGQVLRKNGSAIDDRSAHVDLVVEGDHVATSALSQWGEFVFPEVPMAVYGLHILVLDCVVRIPAVPAL